MSNLLAGLLGALLATNQVSAVSNLVAQTTGISVSVPDPNDPVEKEYEKLLELDDAAQEDADRMIKEAEAFSRQGSNALRDTLGDRLEKRFAPVKQAYESFLRNHPNHGRARIAYGSFLSDIAEEEAAIAQLEKAREVDPKNPAAWNNLANIYGHSGPVKKAFEYYEKAIELKPTEPVYLHNLGTTVYLFRQDAMEHYKISEQEVFDKALALYSKALALDPKNFYLASDFAQSFYGIRPMRVEAALEAWKRALELASDDIERQGVYIHLARVHINGGNFAEAQKHLDLVKHEMYYTLKDRLQRNLERKKAESAAAEKGAEEPSVGIETQKESP